MRNSMKKYFGLMLTLCMILAAVGVVPVTADEAEVIIMENDVTFSEGEQGIMLASETPAVARIGTQEYATLQEALDKVQSGETITLLSDVELTEGISVNKDFGFTLDGNGNSITAAEGANFGRAVFYFNGNSAATYVIQNITFENLDLPDADAVILSKESAGSIKIKKCTFTGNQIGSPDSAVVTSRGVVRLLSDAVVEGCAFDSNTVYSSHPLSVSYGIDGFSISNPVLKVTNNTFTKNTVYQTSVYQTSESVGCVAGVAIVTSGTATLENNTVEANNEFIYNGESVPCRSVGCYKTGTSGQVTIKSGTYNGALVTNENDESIIVEGGTFDTDVSKFVADGYALTSGDSTYTVAASTSNEVAQISETNEGNTANSNVAQIGDTEYPTLQAAIDEAQAGNTITLLSEVELSEPLTIPAGVTVTLDLNGKTISYNSTVLGEAMITNKGSLTINDSIGNGVIDYKYTGAADPTYGKGNYTISNAGNLTVNGGKITIADIRAHAKYPIDNNSTSGDAILVINGGHLYNYNTSAIRQFCNSTTNKNSVTINGGLIEGYSAIWMQNPDSKTVNGQLSITGGEIKTTAAAYVNGTAEVKDVNSKVYCTIVGSGGAWDEKSYVSITGGTFNENVYLAEGAPEDITVNTTSATFNGKVEIPEVEETGVVVVPDNIVNTIIGSDTSVSEAVTENITKIIDEIKNNTAITVFEATAEVDTLSITMSNMKIDKEDASAVPTKIIFDVTPNKAGVNITELTDDITFCLPIPSGVTKTHANVTHTHNSGTTVTLYEIKGKDSAKYIEVTSDKFSPFEVEPVTPVAKIGETGYETLQAAIDAAQPGDTITMLADIELTEGVVVAADKSITLDLAGYTITGAPTEANAFAVITNKGNLTITDTDAGEETGKIICDHKLTGSTAYAVNTITNGGTLIIEKGTIENKSTAANQIGYAIDNNSTSGDAILTIAGGNVTASGSGYYDGIRLFCNSVTNANNVTVKGGEVSSIWMQNPSDGSEKDTKDVKGYVEITEGAVTNLYLEPSREFTASISGGNVGSISYFTTSEGRDVTGFISGGTFASDVSEFCKEGFAPAKGDNDNYTVDKIPNAEVTVCDPITLTAAEHEYSIYNGSLVKGTEDLPLQIVMNFKAKDTLEEATASAFGKWKTDFYLKVEGMSGNTITADNCYLAGNYGEFGWIVIPTDGQVLENGTEYPIVSAYDPELTYENICDYVKDFTAAIYIDDTILEANPYLTVTLSLKLTNPNDANGVLVIGEPAVYTVMDLEPDSVPELPTATVTEIEKEDLTFAMNFKADPVTDEQLAFYGDWFADFELTVNKNVVLYTGEGANGYLSGQYDEWSDNWVNVPFNKSVEIIANEPVKIMDLAAKLMGQNGLKLTYREVYEGVKDFDCGVFFEPEFLVANPDLEVKLELRMYHPVNETKSYTIGETYTYDCVAAVYDGVTVKAVYPSVAEALDKAGSGNTVKLLDDAEEDLLMVNSGVTLDLNGKTLVAKYLIAFEGNHVIDDSNDKSGLLKIDPQYLLLVSNNKQMPVYTEDGYWFATVKINGIEVVDLTTDDSFVIDHRPSLGSRELNINYLADGATDNHLKVQVRCSWIENEEEGTLSNQTFEHSNAMVKKVYTNGTSFRLNVSGLEGITSDIIVESILISERGVVASNTVYTFKPVK